MNSYELTVILHPDLEIDVDAPVARVEQLIKDAGGSITKRDNWGKKRLAYPVKKQQFGMYVFFEVELPSEGVRQLESQLLITEEIIRFLIVKKLILQRPATLARINKSNKKPATTATKE